MHNIKPNVLVVGAQKAATTAVIKNLRKLDGVWAPSKELHFFSVHWAKGTDWYERTYSELVRDVEPEKYDADILIEKSPSYMADPKAAGRIKSYDPLMKIIVCLRNPIERAFSRYNDILIDEPDRINVGFDEIVQNGLKNPDHFIRNGLYAEQLRPFLQNFPREQVFVLVQERLEARGSHEFDLLLAFLGLPLGTIQPNSFNSNIYNRKMSTQSWKSLQDFYRRPNENLFQLLGFSISEWEQGAKIS